MLLCLVGIFESYLQKLSLAGRANGADIIRHTAVTAVGMWHDDYHYLWWL